MHIQITDDARQRLLAVMKEQDSLIQLAYDVTGCGCAVSGVPSLWLIKQPADHELENAGDEQLPILYDQQQAVFFEPVMKLSLNENQNNFKLSSNGQIYHNRLSVTKPPTHSFNSM